MATKKKTVSELSSEAPKAVTETQLQVFERAAKLSLPSNSAKRGCCSRRQPKVPFAK